jgi:hypothetical protein
MLVDDTTTATEDMTALAVKAKEIAHEDYRHEQTTLTEAQSEEEALEAARLEQEKLALEAKLAKQEQIRRRFTDDAIGWYDPSVPFAAQMERIAEQISWHWRNGFASIEQRGGDELLDDVVLEILGAIERHLERQGGV